MTAKEVSGRSLMTSQRVVVYTGNFQAGVGQKKPKR